MAALDRAAYASTVADVPQSARSWLGARAGPETPGRAVLGWIANELFRAFHDNHAAVMTFVDAAADGVRDRVASFESAPEMGLVIAAGRYVYFAGATRALDVERGEWVPVGRGEVRDAAWSRVCSVRNLVRAKLREVSNREVASEPT
jgi:hypothetical protein